VQGGGERWKIGEVGKWFRKKVRNVVVKGGTARGSERLRKNNTVLSEFRKTGMGSRAKGHERAEGNGG